MLPLSELIARRIPSSLPLLWRLEAVRWNSNRASISRTRRSQFLNTYPAILVQPDGSTISVRSANPVGVLKMPLDIEALSADEKRTVLARRKPAPKKQTAKEVEVDLEDSFDAGKYIRKRKK